MTSFVTKETFDRIKALLIEAADNSPAVISVGAEDHLRSNTPHELLLRQAIRQQIQTPTVQKIIRDNHRMLKARFGK